MRGLRRRPVLSRLPCVETRQHEERTRRRWTLAASCSGPTCSELVGEKMSASAKAGRMTRGAGNRSAGSPGQNRTNRQARRSVLSLASPAWPDRSADAVRTVQDVADNLIGSPSIEQSPSQGSVAGSPACATASGPHRPRHRKADASQPSPRGTGDGANRGRCVIQGRWSAGLAADGAGRASSAARPGPDP